MAKNLLEVAFTAFLLTVGVAAMAQGLGHTWFMRGSIVGIDYHGPVVCVGRADGAEGGQVFDAYRSAPAHLGWRHTLHLRKKLGELCSNRSGSR